MARKSEATPHVPSRLVDNLSDLLGELKQLGLTLAPIQTLKPGDRYIPDVAPFSGSPEEDGISIDEWRIRMRLKLRQMDHIKGITSEDRFKANWVLTMVTGRAWLAIVDRHVRAAGRDPTNGLGDAERLLEYICDTIKKKCGPTTSEKDQARDPEKAVCSS